MSKLIINGGVPLQGELRASGAKNAVLPIMAAAILTMVPAAAPARVPIPASTRARQTNRGR